MTATADATFEAMWTEALPAVHAFLRAVAPDPSLHDDLVQNTALTALQKFDQYEPSRPFRAWVIGIARFEVLRSKRAYARGRVLYDSEVFDKLCVAFEQKLVEYDERSEALRLCMERLAPEKRALLALRYEKEMSYDAMAGILNRPEGAVRTHLCRLRSDLKHCIEKRMKGITRGSGIPA